MNLNPISVTSLQVIKTDTSPQAKYIIPREHHSLSYRIEGENTICVNETEILSNARSLTFVPARSSYLHHINTNSKQIVAHFTTIENIGNKIVNFILPTSYETEQMFYSLYQAWEICPIINNVETMAIFYKILAAIHGYVGEVYENKKQILIKASVAYMNSHYRESGFNIATLYEIAHISPAYFRRIFQEIYGCSPLEYMIKLRIEYAKRLLSTGHYTVSEAAELSGFSNQSHFSYDFKKRTGYTPSQYINKN